MVKKRGVVWNYYHKKVDGSQVIAFCKFCDQSYIQNATRMERHMERCPKCPEDVRQQFIQVANNKKAKASIFSLKSNDIWTKQEAIVIDGQIRTDINIENVEEWEFRNQNSSNAMSGSVPIHQYVVQTNQPWIEETTENSDVQNIEESDTTASHIDKAWTSSHGNTTEEEIQEVEETEAEAQKQKRSSPTVIQQIQGGRTGSVHQRKLYAPRRVSQYVMPMRSSGVYSSLQNKIYQEELLERRALRRVAELELRRKTLELERFQWEYQRDKAHSELRWAHESRMMQLKEEKERLAIEQSRAQGAAARIL